MTTVDWQTITPEFLDGLLDADSAKALSITRDALAQGSSPVEFFEACITPVLEEVGNRFERLEVFLPEMALAGEIVKRIHAEVIQPEIEKSAGEEGHDERSMSQGKVILATVQGDIHDIGKTMVGLMLGVNGFEVMDLGTNAAAVDIVETAEREQADIIGLSSLLTTALPYMKDVLGYLEGKGIRDKYYVIVGGASPTPEYAEKIGADAFGHSASEAVSICKDIMASKVPA